MTTTRCLPEKTSGGGRFEDLIALQLLDGNELRLFTVNIRSTTLLPRLTSYQKKEHSYYLASATFSLLVTLMTPDSQIQQSLTYAIEYPVVFTEGVFDLDNPVLVQTMDRLSENRVHRAMVFIDSNVADLLPQITQHVTQYFETYADDIELAEEPRVIPGGEAIKNEIDVVGPMAAALAEAHLCRNSFVIIIGGGAVLDAVGFAASVTHRGLRTIRIPTTVLAQANAGISVKTSINLPGMKNAIGSFAPPFGVINDWQFLHSLPDREWFAGIGEAFRMGIIRDRKFFDDLCDLACTLSQRAPETIRQIIQHSAYLYLSEMSLSNDPFELNIGQPLDFAYWAAHKLEILSSFEVSHGEAVVMGVLINSRYAMEQGWMAESEFDRIHAAFLQLGLPLWFNELDMVGADGNLEILQGIPDYQEQKGGVLSITFPDGIGASRNEQALDLTVMERALNSLKELATSAVELQKR